jgi:hypothetical protein
MAEIPLTRGMVAIVDEEDFAWLSQWKWHALAEGYAARHRMGATILMHRVVADAVPGFNVDHINGNPADNRRRNLRLCTQAENVRNTRRRADNTTGFKGVSLHDSGLYRARLHSEGRGKLVGYFKTPEEAARAYDIAAAKLYGDFARLNFPAELRGAR